MDIQETFNWRMSWMSIGEERAQEFQENAQRSTGKADKFHTTRKLNFVLVEFKWLWRIN